MKNRGVAENEELLRDLVNRIVRAAKPERIVLFGSAVRGELGSDSDLDVLVIKSGDYHRGRLTERIYGELRGLGAAVDVVVAKPEDIERYGDSPALVYASALREGRDIYRA